ATSTGIRPTSPAEVRSICRSATKSSAAWSRTARSFRATVLDAIASEIRREKDRLVEMASIETGLPMGRLHFEVNRSAFQFSLFADAMREASYLAATIDTAARSDEFGDLPDIRRMLVPVGPVAVFGASNFPFAFSVLGGDTASALATGCSVVVKAHPSHPGLSNRVAKVARTALAQAGAPTDQLQVVHGYEAGRILVTHPPI